jgi:uncharacterized coiled-coil protein SlyX
MKNSQSVRLTIVAILIITALTAASILILHGIFPSVSWEFLIGGIIFSVATPFGLFLLRESNKNREKEVSTFFSLDSRIDHLDSKVAVIEQSLQSLNTTELEIKAISRQLQLTEKTLELHSQQLCHEGMRESYEKMNGVVNRLEAQERLRIEQVQEIAQRLERHLRNCRDSYPGNSK